MLRGGGHQNKLDFGPKRPMTTCTRGTQRVVFLTLVLSFALALVLHLGVTLLALAFVFAPVLALSPSFLLLRLSSILG